MRAPFFILLVLAPPSTASGSTEAWYRDEFNEVSKKLVLEGADGSGSEDGQGLQDEANRILEEEESRMRNELDEHEKSLQKLIQLNKDQDAQTDDIGHQLSQTSTEKRELAAQLKSMEGELSGLREKNEIAEQAKRQSEGLSSRDDLLETTEARAGADLRRRLEEEEREGEALEGRLAASRRAGAIQEQLEAFYARKARIVEEAKEFQDHEAELTRELAQSLRNLGAEPEPGMRQKPAGRAALTRRNYAQYHALAASIPELARELRAKQQGVFENLQGMEDSLHKLVQATQ